MDFLLLAPPALAHNHEVAATFDVATCIHLRLFLTKKKHSLVLPSLSLSPHADPNVEVVYVSPVSLDQEILDYYHSLLSTALSGGSAVERVHIISPDISLPPHPLPLSTVLTLNPRSAPVRCYVRHGQYINVCQCTIFIIRREFILDSINTN